MQQIHALVLTEAPSGAVLTTDEAKLHLRVDGTAEDDLIDALVSAATLQAQSELRRALLTQTWQLKLERLPACGEIELPFGANAVTGVTYVDDNGAPQTLAADQYVVDVASAPGRLVRADGVTWPTTQLRPHAVTVTMTCGFGNAAAVPEGIKQWIKLHVGALYRNREAFALGVNVSELPNRFTDALLDPWRLVVV
jgi:uncharacterized phiE125 gp8 family phage protein